MIAIIILSKQLQLQVTIINKNNLQFYDIKYSYQIVFFKFDPLMRP